MKSFLNIFTLLLTRKKILAEKKSLCYYSFMLINTITTETHTNKFYIIFTELFIRKIDKIQIYKIYIRNISIKQYAIGAYHS